MNKSDVSESDFRNDEDEDQVNGKYQPPKAVPISEILALDSNDPSLNKYKKQLIGDAINIVIGNILFEMSLQFSNVLFNKNRAQ